MTEQTRNEIVQRWQDGQSLRSIARTLGVSRHAARRTIEEVQQAREGQEPTVARPRKSPLLDPFDEAIRGLLERYRVVDVEGLVSFQNNAYSVPWRLIGQTLPLR